MYTQYFGFRKPPFKITPDSGFFYSNTEFLAAHCCLLDAIDEQRGLSLLTGDPGTGKTTLLNRLAQDLDETVQFIYLQNSNLGQQDFIGRLLDKLGLIGPEQPRTAIETEISRLRAHLKRLQEQEQSCVLFIDDAQNLPLETLRILPRLIMADNGGNQLQVVLSGARDLADRLADPSVAAVSRIVAARAQLDPLPTDEIASFIDHQIRAAGSIRSDIFSEGAIREIVQITSGRPRDINRICDKALEIAHRQGTQVITREIVRQTSNLSWLDIEALQPGEGATHRPAAGPPAADPPTADPAGKLRSSPSPASRIKPQQWKLHLQPFLHDLARRGAELRNPLARWSRSAGEKLSVMLLVLIAKTWKYGAYSWRLAAGGAKSLLSTAEGLTHRKRPRLQGRLRGRLQLHRRHAWIAGVLLLVAGFFALLAALPSPDNRNSGQVTASNSAVSKSPPANAVQAPRSSTSGRQLTDLAELRVRAAQLDLDLKSNVSNSNYLKKLIGNLTSERDDLAIRLSQLKFQNEQLQTTLATALGRVSSLERDLLLARSTLPSSTSAGQSSVVAALDALTPEPGQSAQEDALSASALDPSGGTSRLDNDLTVSDQTLQPGVDLVRFQPPTPLAGSASAEAKPIVTAAGPAAEPSASADSLEYIGDTASPADKVANSGDTPSVPEAGESTNVISTASLSKQTPQPAGTDHEAIVKLLEKAHRLYNNDFLTTPSKSNALQLYKRVLAAVPGHAEARAGIERIAARYRSWAEAELNHGDSQKALHYLKKAQFVSPGSAATAAQLKALEAAQKTQSEPAQTADAPRSEAARKRLKTLGLEISERSLLRAVQAGNLELIGLLIDAGISPDAQSVGKQTALLTAAINGDQSTARLLLDRGANVNKTNSLGRSPLIAAAWNGDTALTALLLKQGAEIEATSKDGWNALMYASWNGHLSTVRALLENGSRIDAVNGQGWTALMNAAWSGHSETVRVLLEHGANADYRTPSGETALQVASQQGHRETALLLD
jgi:type II secretory pathway predicted ATPase ExeA/ankyrin repeat protein